MDDDPEIARLRRGKKRCRGGDSDGVGAPRRAGIYAAEEEEIEEAIVNVEEEIEEALVNVDEDQFEAPAWDGEALALTVSYHLEAVLEREEEADAPSAQQLLDFLYLVLPPDGGDDGNYLCAGPGERGMAAGGFAAAQEQEVDTTLRLGVGGDGSGREAHDESLNAWLGGFLLDRHHLAPGPEEEDDDDVEVAGAAAGPFHGLPPPVNPASSEFGPAFLDTYLKPADKAAAPSGGLDLNIPYPSPGVDATAPVGGFDLNQPCPSPAADD